MAEVGIFKRLSRLWRGMWSVRMGEAEANNAEAIYHNAIHERLQHHEQLKAAVSRLVYLRNRLEAACQRQQADLQVVEQALQKAVSENRDQQALDLIGKRRQLQEDVRRLTQEGDRLRQQTSTAKKSLHEVAETTRRLKDEQAAMLARKTHAMARISVQQALQEATATNLGALDSALENVRESIYRLEADAGLTEELGADPTVGELSMAALRQQCQSEQDRALLETLKSNQRADTKLLANTANESVFDAILAKPVPVRQ